MTEEAKRDLIIALITLKYTSQFGMLCRKRAEPSVWEPDSNPAFTAPDWQARRRTNGICASMRVLSLPFKAEVKRAERDNAIDVYLSEDYEDVIGRGNWQQLFTENPEAFARSEQRAYLASLSGVCLGSDAFFPFGDNIERAAKQRDLYPAQPGGSIRDDLVIEACDKHKMVMAMTGMRLFHH